MEDQATHYPAPPIDDAEEPTPAVKPDSTPAVAASAAASVATDQQDETAAQEPGHELDQENDAPVMPDDAAVTEARDGTGAGEEADQPAPGAKPAEEPVFTVVIEHRADQATIGVRRNNTDAYLTSVAAGSPLEAAQHIGAVLDAAETAWATTPHYTMYTPPAAPTVSDSAKQSSKRSRKRSATADAAAPPAGTDPSTQPQADSAQPLALF